MRREWATIVLSIVLALRLAPLSTLVIVRVGRGILCEVVAGAAILQLPESATGCLSIRTDCHFDGADWSLLGHLMAMAPVCFVIRDTASHEKIESRFSLAPRGALYFAYHLAYIVYGLHGLSAFKHHIEVTEN